jgi:uncharacterized protein (UPF0216 family)
LFAHQLRAFRQIAPARRASLRELLGSDHPSVETLGGSRHYFRRADLEAASSKLPGELWDARLSAKMALGIRIVLSVLFHEYYLVSP